MSDEARTLQGRDALDSYIGTPIQRFSDLTVAKP